jgi:hypothetical protein
MATMDAEGAVGTALDEQVPMVSTHVHRDKLEAVTSRDFPGISAHGIVAQDG